MRVVKIIGIVILVLGIIVGLGYAFGFNKVLYTKTVVKAQQDADRTVFESTQSYVEGKRQEATKLYKEYNKAESQADKESIEAVVAMSFANFDHKKLEEPLQSFIIKCKYGQ